MKLWEFPNINDVTTSPDDAPVFSDLARREPDTFRSKTKLLFGETLEPLVTDFDADELFLIAETVAEEMDWQIAAINRADRRYEAVSVTPKLKFKDDIAVEVRTTEDEASLHVRSRSRLGRKDFGVNEKRIRKFLAAVQARL